MRFVELVTAHVRVESALRDQRNGLHNFFILGLPASRDGGRADPFGEADLVSRMK